MRLPTKLPWRVNLAWPGRRGKFEVFVSWALGKAASLSFGIAMCVNSREGKGISAMICQWTKGEEGITCAVGGLYGVVNLLEI